MIYKALILNEPYASYLHNGDKKIETRLGRLFSHRGDLVICNNEHPSGNKLATCIVNVFGGRYMMPQDEGQAKIEYDQRRGCLFLKDWRYFNYNFRYKDYYVSGTFQGIFNIILPDDIEIIPQPQITQAIDYLGII